MKKENEKEKLEWLEEKKEWSKDQRKLLKKKKGKINERYINKIWEGENEKNDINKDIEKKLNEGKKEE